MNSFESTPRFKLVLSKFLEAHKTDPENKSQQYHQTLTKYVNKLTGNNPSEALLLAANSQHIKRWTRPRSSYPDGLSAYKMWRTGLNKFHSETAKEIMLDSGYSEEEDSLLLSRVNDLLLKKHLQRPPLSKPFKDPEMHVFEDSICLTFLELQFIEFNEAISDTEKMEIIVRKTWAKMSEEGQAVVVSELLEGMPADIKVIVGRALE